MTVGPEVYLGILSMWWSSRGRKSQAKLSPQAKGGGPWVWGLCIRKREDTLTGEGTICTRAEVEESGGV